MARLVHRAAGRQMPDTDDVALWYALYRLATNYWYEVDFNGGARAHEYYVPDGLLRSAAIGSRGMAKFVRTTRGASAAATSPHGIF